jgi:hypothetical protein
MPIPTVERICEVPRTAAWPSEGPELGCQLLTHRTRV